jgi:hypothetical protein
MGYFIIRKFSTASVAFERGSTMIDKLIKVFTSLIVAIIILIAMIGFANVINNLYGKY